jgi:hypothetical protein
MKLPVDGQHFNKNKLIFLILLFMWIGLLIYLSGVPHLLAGTQGWLIRKLGHTAIYGILTFLFWKNISCLTNKFFLRALLCIIAVSILAVYDEVHQMSIPGRCGNYKGLLFDGLGVVLILGWLHISHRRLRPNR